MKSLKFFIPLILFFLPLLLIILMFGAGEADFSSKVFASEGQAYEYQYVSQELGVPWDIVMLADAVNAWWNDENDIEELNPILTALEFCILQEDIYEAVPIYEDILVDEYFDDELDEMVYVYETVQVGIEWVLRETRLHKGTDKILSYINRSRDSINTRDATNIVVAIMDIAEKKSCDEWKYDTTLFTNLNYKYVLGELLDISDDDIEFIIEMHNAQYLAELYGYEHSWDMISDINVPVITGNATRADLARTAVSLINWPYQLGGKSPRVGAPAGPLDCSGYVDWVYIQCFGVGVSAGGRVPAGIAVSGTAIQFYASEMIEEGAAGLRVGDLGFTKHPRNVKAGEYNHVGIYLGKIGGQQAWIHCAGRAFGFEERPSGRVGISLPSGSNNYDHISGIFYEPPMGSITFNYFRRPRFIFAGD